MQVLDLIIKNNINLPFKLGQEIGTGADGQCYNLIDFPNKIIKLSVLYQMPDQNIDNHFKQIENVLFELIQTHTHTYAQVYEYKYLGTFQRIIYMDKKQKYILYYYVMEKLHKLSEDEKKVFHSILSHEDMNIVKNYPPAKLKKMLQGMSRGLDFDEKRVTFFYENFRKAPVIHNDLHTRNIMKNEAGDFKLVDFDRCQLF